MGKARKLAILLSIGGTGWVFIGIWCLLGLHLDRIEAAGFFVLTFLPALAIYCGWVLRALDWIQGRDARPVWIASLVVTFSYLLMAAANLGFSLAGAIDALSLASLLLAIGFCVDGLAKEKQTDLDPELAFGSMREASRAHSAHAESAN